ncbi:E3 ubiquitin-protein ligase RNF217-like [Entelurus aequoreus]|uniref:E3 ubiquitin-protein ligase RNF217-like n=1 Tax=Entelurus aequoreus TaxID=161455 RepID=UPI002B1DC5FE|nr:E3 ubiquitin-protein ligase RNF217-like [Entelurus aequoreus]
MDDDAPIHHKKPTFTDDKMKASSEPPAGSSKVELSLRNLDRRRASKVNLSRAEEEEEEEKEDEDAEDNNNNNCNGAARGAGIVELIRGSLLAWTSPLDRTGTDGRMPGGSEGVLGDATAACDVSSRYEGEQEPHGKQGHAGVQNEPSSAAVTSSSTRGFDLVSLLDRSGNNISVGDSSSVTEHVYCAVYCIANDSDVAGFEHPDDTIITAEQDADSSGNELVLHTTEDLVDPLRGAVRRLSTLQTGAHAAQAQPCRVCLEEKTIAPLPCCRKPVCDDCLTVYVRSQVQEAKTSIRCPISECSGLLEDALVVSLLDKEDVLRYRYFKELSQLDSSTKPCPRCKHFTSLTVPSPIRSEHKYKIKCSNCQFVWCFRCHAPWHHRVKCRDYRKGDTLLKKWASAIERGQRNAQKCPKCKVHIQRTEGCDHMICGQCYTNFCYRCGERFHRLKFFGDHSSNLSVFGCKYGYLPNKPHLRRLIRGSICGLKVLVAPVVISLVLVFGALALVIGVIGFPIYYVCKKRKKQRFTAISFSTA